MASALNIHDADDQPNGTSAAEDERVIDISSPMQDVSRHDTSTKHEETTPHQDVNLQEAQAQEEGQGPTTLLGLQCATPPVMLPPSPPLTVADPREGAESEASISAVIGSSAQPQNVAITPPNMQEEDVTNWRVSMGGEQAEVRREVLEEETEGELEGEYDPYDLGYSPVTPVAPSGLPASRNAEGSRVTSDHPLRFAGKTPSPPPWELIDPPEPGQMPMSNAFNVNRPQYAFMSFLMPNHDLTHLLAQIASTADTSFGILLWSPSNRLCVSHRSNRTDWSTPSAGDRTSRARLFWRRVGPVFFDISPGTGGTGASDSFTCFGSALLICASDNTDPISRDYQCY